MPRFLAIALGLTLAVLASCQSPPAAVAPSAPVAPTAPGAAESPGPVSAVPSPPDEPVPLGPLPAGVWPTHETLAFDIDPARDRFSGTAEIAIHLDHPRARIWLHGRGLAVHSAVLVLASGVQVSARWEEVDPSGVVRLTPEAPGGRAVSLDGDVVLRVAFDAAYDPQLVGVYRVSTPAGPAVFSKFEAIYARRAFPCFDEPAFKLPYDVALTVPATAEVIGNMPIAETAPVAAGSGGGAARKHVRFQTTPPLPSYLVAFAVGPFETRYGAVPPTEIRAAPLPLAAIAIRGRGQDTGYALVEERVLLAEQERYFGIKFPFPKLDLVAVPDFQSGAMENAGAITFRDSRLLIDDKVASLGDRVAVTSVIAHETAHQWFGDFVTMRWWDDLWLNEGFATFLDTLTLRAVRPELEAELQAAYRTNGVMKIDALTTARRIRQPIQTPHDITNAFDGITYEKGAAVLTMLEHFVGAEPFRRGLHEFLAAHASGNATTDELVRALADASHKQLGPLVASFLDQPGVPVVGASARCEAGRGRVELTQAPWRATGSTAPAGARWTIPVCVRYAAGGKIDQACALLDAPTGSIELPACPDWILPNADAAGYYRSALAADDLQRLRSRGLARLSTVERVQLGRDLEAAFDSAALPAADVLRALEALARDPHGAVALVPLGLLDFIDGYVMDAPGAQDPQDARRRAALRARIARLYAPAVAQLGWTPSAGERPWRRRLRAELLGFLAIQIEAPPVLAEAARLGRRMLGVEHRSGPGAGAAGGRMLHLDAVATDLADVALAAAARTGGADVFDALVEELGRSSDAQLRQRILIALAQTRQPPLVARALDLALDPKLRQNERLVALDVLLRAPATRDAAWTWLTAHFDALMPLLPDRYGGMLPRAIRMCDRRRIDEVRAFLAPRVEQLTGGPRNLAQALESAEQCIAEVAAQRASVAAYLDGR
ncbi:MAG TPA: M1 family metallopeptidase [Kofleriaceae bacterium]|nr:M1 family metallopeptidase [Kofleriaceae bacterium]